MSSTSNRQSRTNQNRTNQKRAEKIPLKSEDMIRRVNLSYITTKTHFFSLFFCFVFYSTSIHMLYCTILYLYDTWQLSFLSIFTRSAVVLNAVGLSTIFVFSFFLTSSFFDLIDFRRTGKLLNYIVHTYFISKCTHTFTHTHTHTHRIYFLFSCLIVALHTRNDNVSESEFKSVSDLFMLPLPPSLPPSLLCNNFGIAK